MEVSCPLRAFVLLTNSPLTFPLRFTPEGALPSVASLNPRAGPGREAQLSDQEAGTQTRGLKDGAPLTCDQAEIQSRLFRSSFFRP